MATDKETKILELIPESLRPQLFKEVLDKIEEDKKKEKSKQATDEEIQKILERL